MIKTSVKSPWLSVGFEVRAQNLPCLRKQCWWFLLFNLLFQWWWWIQMIKLTSKMFFSPSLNICLTPEWTSCQSSLQVRVYLRSERGSDTKCNKKLNLSVCKTDMCGYMWFIWFKVKVGVKCWRQFYGPNICFSLRCFGPTGLSCVFPWEEKKPSTFYSLFAELKYVLCQNEIHSFFFVLFF